jgi:hypothetical protein
VNDAVATLKRENAASIQDGIQRQGIDGLVQAAVAGLDIASSIRTVIAEPAIAQTIGNIAANTSIGLDYTNMVQAAVHTLDIPSLARTEARTYFEQQRALLAQEYQTKIALMDAKLAELGQAKSALDQSFAAGWATIQATNEAAAATTKAALDGMSARIPAPTDLSGVQGQIQGLSQACSGLQAAVTNDIAKYQHHIDGEVASLSESIDALEKRVKALENPRTAGKKRGGADAGLDVGAMPRVSGDDIAKAIETEIQAEMRKINLNDEVQKRLKEQEITDEIRGMIKAKIDGSNFTGEIRARLHEQDIVDLVNTFVKALDPGTLVNKADLDKKIEEYVDTCLKRPDFQAGIIAYLDTLTKNASAQIAALAQTAAVPPAVPDFDAFSDGLPSDMLYGGRPSAMDDDS